MNDSLLINSILIWIGAISLLMALLLWKAYAAAPVYNAWANWRHEKTRDDQPKPGDVWVFDGLKYTISPGRMRPVRMGDNPDAPPRFRWALRHGDKIMWIDDAEWKSKVLKAKAYRSRKG